MSDLWSFLLQTLTASLTALLLLLVKRLFRDKLSPRWQFGIWSVLALRLLLPAGLGGRYALADLRLWLEPVKLLAEDGLASVLSGPWTLTRVSAPIPLLPRGLPAPRSVTDGLFYLYAAGALLSALWFLLAYLRLRAALRRGERAPPARLAQLDRVGGAYGLKSCRAVEVEGVGSAFVCGLIRPVLVLPRGRAVDDKVILHELLHLRCGDVWAGVLLCALRCLHWCNPLIWYCCDRAQNDCEALCDQRVLERLEGEARRDYGHILLSMAEERYARAPGTSSMANGARSLHQRIACIARFKRYPAGMALASLCVGAILMGACAVGTPPASGPADPPGSPATAKTDPRLLRAAATVYPRLRRATTPAGALDTFAKALMGCNGIYLAMVSPLSQHEAIFSVMGDQAPYFPGELTGGIGRGPQYSVHNFQAEQDGSYTAVLAFPRGDRQRDKPDRLNWIRVRVSYGEGWEVAALERGSRSMEAGSYSTDWGCGAVPPVRIYRGEGTHWQGEAILWTTQAIRKNEIISTGSLASLAGSTVSYESRPLPDAQFESWTQSVDYTARFTGTPEQAARIAHVCLRCSALGPGGMPPPFPSFATVRGDGGGSSTDGSSYSARTVTEDWDLTIRSGSGSIGGAQEGGAPPEGFAIALYRDYEIDEVLTLLPVRGGGAL